MEADCNEGSVESIGSEDEFMLFPNPADKTVTILGETLCRKIHSLVDAADLPIPTSLPMITAI